ncbi:hypothetical protein R1flu_014687 [Riccia fluitans]|uniref:Rad60/SUMO-like domain-containing protein n=1 Tax=Riccia fluitans TaxID=41844 RepID=A0ABD1YGT0_9MARC
MSLEKSTLKRKTMKDPVLDPLFDYSRVTPAITLEDSDDDDVKIIDKIEAMTRRRPATKPRISLQSDIGSPDVTIAEKTLEDDDDWLTLPKHTAVSAVVQPVDPHILELRRQKEEFLKLSLLIQAETAQLEADANRAKLEPSSVVSHAVDSLRDGGARRAREKILLQLQEQGGKIHPVKIFFDDKFEKLLTIFSEKIAKRPATDFILRFDGAAIDLRKSPKELELEDEDIIEIHLKSAQASRRV